MAPSIDQAEWHYGGDFPGDLPPENGGTHIGMYLAWIIHRDLGSAVLRKYTCDSLPLLRERKITGRKLLFTELDERFLGSLLTKVGKDFTRDYYETNCYIDDYEAVEAARGRVPGYHTGGRPNAAGRPGGCDRDISEVSLQRAPTALPYPGTQRDREGPGQVPDLRMRGPTRPPSRSRASPYLLTTAIFRFRPAALRGCYE
jgi:hypothetical protein